jgi:hypothetical protein
MKNSNVKKKKGKSPRSLAQIRQKQALTLRLAKPN